MTTVLKGLEKKTSHMMAVKKMHSYIYITRDFDRDHLTLEEEKEAT